jgi:hypothetical protein
MSAASRRQGPGGSMRRGLFLALIAILIPACDTTNVLVQTTGGTGGGGGGGGGGSTTTTWSLIYTDPVGGGTVEVNNIGTVRRIQGTFLDDLDLGAGIFSGFTGTYLLNGPMFMGQDISGNAAVTGGPTLTIPPGTLVQGKGGVPPAMLVIRRGAKINAAGTLAQPIVFTSAKAVGTRASGDWGGVIINGNSQVNDTGGGAAVPTGEGGSGRYGAIPPILTDNSGVMTYCRIEFAGHIFTSDDELNGLALQGVGSGTTIHHLQIHRNSDDGIEFFGGTVNVTHLVVTGCEDDSIDWTGGWAGTLQFAVAQQYTDFADNGIEADGNGTNNAATPFSHPTLANITLIGSRNGSTTSSNQGVLLRQGTRGNIYHSIVANFRVVGLDIDQASTFNGGYSGAPPYDETTLNGNLTVERSLFFQNGPTGAEHFPTSIEGSEPITVSAFNDHITASATYADNAVVVVNPLTANFTNQSAPDFKAAAGGAAVTGVTWAGPVAPVNGYTFVQTTYIGAMDHQAGNDWTVGWTAYPQN